MKEKVEERSTNIFERELTGDLIGINDPEYPLIREVIESAFRLTAKLNSHTGSFNDMKELFCELIGKKVDQTFRFWPPFYTDFGKNITIGKNVFINHACTFMDRGGITVEDDVLIGPKVNLITTSHSLDVSERKNTISKPITIRKNVWIGAAVTVMPGVTIGENSVVGAGAVVTKDVPANVVVAGVPAKIIKYLDLSKY